MNDDDPNHAPTLAVAAASRSALARIIWTLAWPVILTMSVESLVGLVDMLMVGQLGAEAVAGVGVATQLLFAVNTVIFGIGTGTIAVVARHFGARQRGEANHVLAQSVLAGAALMSLFVVPVIAFAPAIVGLFNVDAAVAATSVSYLRIVLMAVPLEAVLVIGEFGLRGAGDTRTPLVASLVVAVVKIVANYVLIFGAFGLPALGTDGAAYASAIAFSTGALFLFALLGSGNLVLQLPRQWYRPVPAVMRRVLAVGYPAAIEHFLMQIGFVIYFSFAAAYDTTAVAAYVIGVRILGLSFLPGIGFSVAAGALVGQNLGAQLPNEARRSGWGTVGFSFVLMTVAGFVIFVAAEPIASLFVDDPHVIAEAVLFIQILAAAQPLMAVDFTLGGALRGAGDTRFPLIVVLLGFYGCRLGFAYYATHIGDLGLFWLWFALVPDYVVRVILKVWRFQSERWVAIRV